MRHSLIPLYREMHGQAHFSGISIYGYAEQLTEIIQTSGAKSLLDYGCGKGRQYIEGRLHEFWGIMPTLYDPAVPELATRPEGIFDGVICTDVMEHILEDELDETLADIRSYARLWCFLSICCEPAKKALPDGRNVHVTIRPKEWWVERLAGAFQGGPEVHVSFDRPHKRKPATARKVSKDLRTKYGWR